MSAPIRFAVLFQENPTPPAGGIYKPMKPGGYRDSGSDIAFALHSRGHSVATPVAAPDPAYAYKILDTIKSPGQTTFILELTSQSWLTEKEVDQPVWKHWLTIVRPDVVKSSKALMVISGGATGKPAPKSTNTVLLLASAATGSITAEVRMIPSQPLTFTGDKPRTDSEKYATTSATAASWRFIANV